MRRPRFPLAAGAQKRAPRSVTPKGPRGRLCLSHLMARPARQERPFHSRLFCVEQRTTQCLNAAANGRMYAGRPLLLMTVDYGLRRMLFCRDAVEESSAVSHALASLVRVASSYRPRPSRTTASSVAQICRTEMDRRRHQRFGTRRIRI